MRRSGLHRAADVISDRSAELSRAYLATEKSSGLCIGSHVTSSVTLSTPSWDLTCMVV